MSNVQYVETENVAFSWDWKYFHYTDTSGNTSWIPDGSVVGNYAGIYVNPYDSSKAAMRLPLLNKAHHGYTYASNLVVSAGAPVNDSAQTVMTVNG